MFTQTWGPGCEIRIARSYCKRLGEFFLRLHFCLSRKSRPNFGKSPPKCVPQNRASNACTILWHTLRASTSCTTLPRNKNFDVYSNLGARLRNSDCQIILQTFGGIFLTSAFLPVAKIAPELREIPAKVCATESGQQRMHDPSPK